MKVQRQRENQGEETDLVGNEQENELKTMKQE